MNFGFENGEKLECIELNGEPLFNPYSVGKCLGLGKSSVRNHLTEMDDSERVLIKNSDVLSNDIRKLNNAGEVFIKEAGLYQLIFKSRKAEARVFVKWVTSKVLPEIRRTGSYNSNRENIRARELLDTMTRNLAQLTGVMPEEIAITQHESYNKRLSNLMIDCSTRGLGTISELYDELFYVFAGETGINIPEIAELQGLKRMDYLRKNRELSKTIYEFAHRHFSNVTRQVALVNLDKQQKALTDF